MACNFENDFCGYYNVNEFDQFDWERGQGEDYQSTGPSVDHTTETEEVNEFFLIEKWFLKIIISNSYNTYLLIIIKRDITLILILNTHRFQVNVFKIK